MSLNNLSVRLGELGRREEGLAAVEEAVDAYRRLAGANPAAYLPDLAASLNNLSARLGELGRHEDAARAAEDAAAAGRHRLATDDKLYPELHTPMPRWDHDQFWHA
jgi:tetratricopeptide (TPR) repeat protein